MIVKWNKPNAGIKFIQGKRGDVILKPGGNEIDNETWEGVSHHVKLDPERNFIEVIADEEKTDKAPAGLSKKQAEKYADKDGKFTVNKPKKLTDIGPEKAIDIIRDTWDVETLKLWRRSEDREDVRVEISKQIEEINKPPVR